MVRGLDGEGFARMDGGTMTRRPSAAGAIYRTAAKTLEREEAATRQRGHEVWRLSEDLLAEATALIASADQMRESARALRELADAQDDAEALKEHWGPNVVVIEDAPETQKNGLGRLRGTGLPVETARAS